MSNCNFLAICDPSEGAVSVRVCLSRQNLQCSNEHPLNIQIVLDALFQIKLKGIVNLPDAKCCVCSTHWKAPKKGRSGLHSSESPI